MTIHSHAHQARVPKDDLRSAARAATILIADDHDLIRSMMRTVLEEQGHVVLEARDGVVARRILGEHSASIDLLIVDGVMPGADGVAVLSLARELSPLMPVILSSGYGNRGLSDELLGTVEFLPKPYDSQELVDRVEKMLTTSALCFVRS